MKIGKSIRDLRHSQGRTLQQICDACGGRIQAGYLSRIERDEIAPSIYTAVDIANALGTSINQLLDAAKGKTVSSGLPSATRLLVPVFDAQAALTFCKERSIGKRPTPIRWVLPPVESSLSIFAMLVPDDSMHAPEGLSFSKGTTIIIDMDLEATAEDYVVISDSENSPPVFRQLSSDGLELFLRPRNPQYPMRPVPETPFMLGVVVAQVLELKRED